MGRSSIGAAAAAGDTERRVCGGEGEAANLCLEHERDFCQALSSWISPGAAMYYGNTCHSVTSPLAHPTLCRTQPSPDPKPLLPFRLRPGFPDSRPCPHVPPRLQTDRAHKAPTGPGLGLTSPLKRKTSSCGVCRRGFNSEVQASSSSPLQHGATKRAKMLKAADAPDPKTGTSEPAAEETSPQTPSPPCSHPSSSDTASGAPSPTAAAVAPTETVTAAVPPDTSLSLSPGMSERHRDEDVEAVPDGESEEEKAIRLLYCSLCKVAVNSASQLQAHNSGTKHKTMLEARSGDGAIKSFPRTGVKAKLAALSESSTGLQNKTFHCEICNVHVNSETQLKQHISSRRHKDRAAGKPAKPKFSPYTPTQRQPSLQAIRLSLRKKQDLTEPLGSCLLQRQLFVAAAAAMATLAPFPLRSASNSSPALFQSQPLPPALLHPAPGPICSTHTPVLFSPY